MLAVIKHVVDDNIIYLSAIQLMHAPAHGARNTVQQLLRKTLNFISPELWSQQARIKLNWLQDLGSVNISCKSTKLKKSSSNWLNTGKALIQQLTKNMRFLCFRALPGSAEALVRWGGKIKYHLTTYITGNITATNYQNRLMYVEVIASQSSVVYRHKVYDQVPLLAILACQAQNPLRVAGLS